MDLLKRKLHQAITFYVKILEESKMIHTFINKIKTMKEFYNLAGVKKILVELVNENYQNLSQTIKSTHDLDSLDNVCLLATTLCGFTEE